MVEAIENPRKDSIDLGHAYVKMIWPPAAFS
jgi:hypothetical protein